MSLLYGSTAAKPTPRRITPNLIVKCASFEVMDRMIFHLTVSGIQNRRSQWRTYNLRKDTSTYSVADT
jgi:hypothetical protein